MNSDTSDDDLSTPQVVRLYLSDIMKSIDRKERSGVISPEDATENRAYLYRQLHASYDDQPLHTGYEVQSFLLQNMLYYKRYDECSKTPLI